jgi:hypothetical protein
MRRALAAAAVVLVVLVACGPDNPNPAEEGSHNDPPQHTCELANNLQREATKVLSDIASGSPSGTQKDILDLGDATHAVLSGASRTTPLLGDLSAVYDDVSQLDDDFKSGNGDVNADAAALRNDMTRLGMDCSKYLG